MTQTQTDWPRRSTPMQQRILSRLTIELRLLTIRARNEWLEKELGHEVHHLIDLSAAEAAAAIDVARVELAVRKAKKE